MIGADWDPTPTQILLFDTNNLHRSFKRLGSAPIHMLLPNTDSEGCKQVGEKVRGALHALGMLHALNPPSKRVTVSLGGATNLRGGGTAERTSVVEAADRAMYAAGRDWVFRIIVR